MLYRVAQRLGYTTVAQLVDEVPREELNNWLAVCWIDGWGEDNWRAAQVAKEVHDILLMMLRWFGVQVATKDFKTIEQTMPRQSRPIRPKPKQAQEQLATDSTLDWMQNMIRVHHRK